ncbi:MAG: SCO7613 C-terminal domain-containing membrane protein [Carbonactinosporaceae bacterium]
MTRRRNPAKPEERSGHPVARGCCRPWISSPARSDLKGRPVDLAGGVVRLRRHPDASSWTTVGPAASAALLPSAWVSLSDPGLTRPLLTLVAAVVVLVGGLWLLWQAAVLTGAVAALLVAGSQLAPYALGAPRWLSLGAAGALLLALGARYEQRRRDALNVARWFAALH